LYFGTRNFISYSNIFLIFGTLKLFMMTTNLFVIANVKHLRTGGSFRILLLFPNILGFWRPRFSKFNSFHSRVEFGTILEGLRNFGGGGLNTQTPLGMPLLPCPIFPKEPNKMNSIH